MAISKTHFLLLQELKAKGVLQQGGSILEIGKANWYGDAPVSLVDPDLPVDADPFQIARRVYETLLSPRVVTSIDLDHAAVDAQRHDLNTVEAASGDVGAFDLCINHGTAEHIFNIANVFRLMHDATADGGVMIHESPFTGWVDHGFYSLQPTLFWDVAAANGYEVVGMWLEHLASQTIIQVLDRGHVLWMTRADQLPNNAMLFVVMRKGGDAEFRVPMQSVYSAGATEETRKAWRELR